MLDLVGKVPGGVPPALPRFIVAGAAVCFALVSVPAVAQGAVGSGAIPAQSSAPIAGLPPAAARPVPDQLQLAKLIWSTMAAVDHANRSGNYSVVRDISASGFQINNDPAKLAQVFSAIRNSRIDLGNALLVPPTYTSAPQQVQPEIFQVRGIFNLRPIAMAFDLYFQWERGEWRMYGIDLQPLPMNDTIRSDPRPG